MLLFDVQNKRLSQFLKITSVLFLVFVVPNTSIADRHHSTVRMLSLNFNSEAMNNTLKKKRLPRIEKYVVDNDLDVLMIQEAWQIGKYKNFADKLASDLNMDVVSHFEDGLTGVMVTSISIIAKKSLKLRNSRAYKLPHSAPTLGDGKHFWLGLGQVNMLIGANITLPTGEIASIWTAHLSTTKSSYRVDQVNFALSKIKALAQYNNLNWKDTLTIFAGDLNADPISQEMNNLRAAGFFDLWQASHPFDPGHTLVGDETDPEYNPIVHGTGQFPDQSGLEDTARIDYIYARIPKPFFTTLGRVFTAPIDNVWMSDHFGLRAEIDLAGEILDSLPSSDSDFSKLSPPVVFDVTQKNEYSLPERLDFNVSTERGLTLRNFAHAEVDFGFTAKRSMVYTASGGTLIRNHLMSYVFFGPGDYPYKLIVKTHDAAGTEITTEGVVHVRNGYRD